MPKRNNTSNSNNSNTKTYVQTPRGRFSKIVIKARNPNDQVLVDMSLSHHCRLCTLSGKPARSIRSLGNMRRHLLTQHPALIAPQPKGVKIPPKKKEDSSTSSNSSDTDDSTDTDTESDDDDDDAKDEDYLDPEVINKQLAALKDSIASNNKQLEAILAQLKK